MYTFREVNKQDVNKFAVENGVFQQTSYWSDFRRLFKTSAFLGSDGKEDVLSCIIFRLPVYCTPFSIGYITRGFVCDYSNTQLITEFTVFLKQYMKKHHIVYLIFDPQCDYKIDFNIIQPDLDQLFLSLGYEKNNGIKMQPVTNYRVNFNINNNPEQERKAIYKKFAPKLKNDIQISTDRGVVCERAAGKDLDRAVEIFYNLLIETADKKGFGRRSLEYYKKFANSLSEFVTIYLYKYDSERDIKYTNLKITECETHLKAIDAEIGDPQTTDKKRERLYPKRKEVIKQLEATKKRLTVSQKYNDNPYISASFFIKMGSRAYNFYGANASALRELRLTSNYWDMMSDSFDGRVTTFNMGGTLKLDTDDIKKDKTYDLYQYKHQYAGQLVQFPGEYYLINNRKMFNLLNTKLNYFKRIVFRF